MDEININTSEIIMQVHNLFHSANNVLKVFAAGGNLTPQTEMIINLVVIVVVLGGYLFYLIKSFPMKELF